MVEKSSSTLWSNSLILILTPLLAAILTPIYIYYNGVHYTEILSFILFWILTGLGITAGYHRLWAHRSYAAKSPVRTILAICGAGALENSIASWTADHRRHHKYEDTEQDPYAISKGFWFAHFTWALKEKKGKDVDTDPLVVDIMADPIARWQHRNYLLITLGFNFGLPILIGLFTGRVGGQLLWACLLRLVFVHHATFLVNSLCHYVGSSKWKPETTARDNWFVALLSFGEGYHNYHHAYPFDYRNGTRWYDFDPTKWLIWTLAKTKLASKLKQRAKSAA